MTDPDIPRWRLPIPTTITTRPVDDDEAPLEVTHEGTEGEPADADSGSE